MSANTPNVEKYEVQEALNQLRDYFYSKAKTPEEKLNIEKAFSVLSVLNK